MWHPLLWIPEHVASRFAVDVQTDDGGQALGEETDDVYAVRVALQMHYAGLYDIESGTWRDVLSMADLDVQDPAVVERVAGWLDGDDDDALDALAVQIEGLLTFDDARVLAEVAARTLPELFQASWCLRALDLYSRAQECAQMAVDPSVSVETAFTALATVAGAGDMFIAHTTADPQESKALWSAATASAEAVLERGPQDSDRDLVTQILASLVPELQQVVEANLEAATKMDPELLAAVLAEADHPAAEPAAGVLAAPERA
jgi:hypothetical protein